MLDYEKLFSHYQNGQRDELIVELLPWLERLARAALSGLRSNADPLQELVSAGTVTLIEEIDKRLCERQLSSGRHLIRSLRLPLVKELKKTRRRLSPVPLPLPKTLERRKKANKPLYKIGQPRKRISLPTDRQLEKMLSKGREKCLNSFFAPSYPAAVDRYWKLVSWVQDAAQSIAKGSDARIVRCLLHRRNRKGKALSISEVASMLKIPRSTVRDRLRRLGVEIAASANLEMAELLEEFCQQFQKSPAGKAFGGQRNKGAAKRSSQACPATGTLVLASRDIWAKVPTCHEDSVALSV